MGKKRSRKSVSIKPRTYLMAGKLAEHPSYRDRWVELNGSGNKRHAKTGTSTLVELLIADAAAACGLDVTEDEVTRALEARRRSERPAPEPPSSPFTF